MASENVEIVKRGYEALSGGDFERIFEFIHPDFETTTPAGLAAEPDTYRGHEGVRRYFESFYEVMEDIRFVPEAFHEVGDLVVVEVTLYATGKSTGLETEQPSVGIWTLKDGRAIGVRVFATLDEAMAVARSAGESG
jgi:uncharacterized protein